MNKFKLLPHLLVLLLIGCSTTTWNWHASSSPGGIGGTGLINESQPGGGIGGTGKQLEEGIGGTGQVAKQDGGSGIGGTGIVGTITGFGSIWVNDAHIHFDETTPVTINQAPATSGALQLGQVVAVSTTPEGEEFQANSIDIVHEVVGPIHKLFAQDNYLEILNQKVRIESDTVLFNTLKQSGSSLGQLQEGTFIEVSGLRLQDGDIIASRVDVVAKPEQVQLIGELKQHTNGAWQINKQSIEIDALLLPESIDKRHLVSGYLEGDILVAQAVGLDSIEVVLEDASELIYEGYYFEDEMEGLVTVGGMEFIVEDLIEFSDEYDFDEPLRVNATLSEEGLYEAEDLLIELEHNDYFIDLIHEYGEEFGHDEGWIEEDYFEDEFYDEHYDEEEFEDEL